MITITLSRCGVVAECTHRARLGAAIEEPFWLSDTPEANNRVPHIEKTPAVDVSSQTRCDNRRLGLRN